MIAPTKRMRRPPSTLGAFVTKELHHILRDRQTLAILLLMPLVQVLLFGYALRTDIRDLRVAVVDPTPDVVTQRLRSRLAATTRAAQLALEVRQHTPHVDLHYRPGVRIRRIGDEQHLRGIAAPERRRERRRQHDRDVRRPPLEQLGEDVGGR